jgi:magnesium-transporting ATPase (P-type)
VYRNIKKAVLLLMSTAFAEVLVLLFAVMLGYPPPFAAVQILWNNLVTEGAITVNLIMDPAEGDEMRQPPISTREPLRFRRRTRRARHDHGHPPAIEAERAALEQDMRYLRPR